MTNSALYRGSLVHVRQDQHARRFRYPIVTACLELDELPALHRQLRLFSYNRPNLWSFYDRDHDDDGRAALAGYHAQLDAAGLPRPATARLVTQLRTAHYVFNPVAFWLGYDRAGALASVIADVRNTYDGRHRYVLGPAQRVASRPVAPASSSTARSSCRRSCTATPATPSSSTRARPSAHGWTCTWTSIARTARGCSWPTSA